MPPRTRPLVVRLSEGEKQRLRTFASEIPYPSQGSFDPFVLNARGAVAAALDPVTLRVLDAVKNDARPPAPVVFENLPFDPSVVRGPKDPAAARTHKPDALSEGILVGVAALLGEPYAIRREGEGLVSNLAASPAHANRTTGLGSRVELGLHVENAAARLLEGDRAPEGLALIGVSPEPGVQPATMVADGRAALALAGPDCERVLRDPAGRFGIQVPERWREAGGGGHLPTPLLAGPAEAPTFVAALYGDMTVGLDPEAEAALAAFRTALAAVTVDVTIRPGVLALLDNRFVFHGRRAFEARFDADGSPYRWLQRVFWTTSLRRFGAWERHRGRVIEPRL